MDFTDEEKDVIANALHNYFEAITDAIQYDKKMSVEDEKYFLNRLRVMESLIIRIDPHGVYV